nr:D-alanyl-D-alanine carboxypeptidase family protein [uncultured Blautia sp.]
MKIKKLSGCLLALGLSFSLLFQTPVMAAEETASGITTNNISGWPQGADVTSTAAVVMEDSTNTTLYAKNADQVLYPGAAVKVMTTLLALEKTQLTDQVTMTATGVSGVTDGGANISAQLDEVFTIEQCLYAIMLASANDIALQVAEHIGGSVDGFVQMMNSRAAELGCTNTLFTNPTGLPDENQHTTAHDMALIMKAAIDNDSFRTIAATGSYTIPATNVSGGDRVLTNNFSMMNATNAAYYQYCLGGKEGYTEASQSTLVCAAQKDNVTLIAVVLQGASGTTATEAASLLNYGFDNFQMLSLGDNDFNMISGGNVYVPAGATADSLTTQDGEVSDGQYNRQYFFSDTPVGTAVMAATQEQDTTLTDEGQKNMSAAQTYSSNRTDVPYFVIGGVGILLLLLILLRIIKVAKS